MFRPSGRTVRFLTRHPCGIIPQDRPYDLFWLLSGYTTSVLIMMPLHTWFVSNGWEQLMLIPTIINGIGDGLAEVRSTVQLYPPRIDRALSTRTCPDVRMPMQPTQSRRADAQITCIVPTGCAVLVHVDARTARGDPLRSAQVQHGRDLL